MLRCLDMQSIVSIYKKTRKKGCESSRQQIYLDNTHNPLSPACAGIDCIADMRHAFTYLVWLLVNVLCPVKIKEC
jgi:hypothetical protein